ncbi:hypothetical protein E2C01_081566 [Portunus trituberculatus]|uniref:Uncharacterized protein n=1 Tax=Portunus trituberculatus TaxID=210409 RepID=A0A5B7IML1_PORTR|nr:hypothetical protein [Portunus trituberculatus]
MAPAGQCPATLPPTAPQQAAAPTQSVGAGGGGGGGRQGVLQASQLTSPPDKPSSCPAAAEDWSELSHSLTHTH